jgi:glyoxylase-like metal-dependent hydrolase (beta-lactamase superfamily II)
MTPSMRVGDLEVQGVSDGHLYIPMESIVRIERAQAEHLFGGSDPILLPVNNFFIRRGEKNILIDAGTGSNGAGINYDKNRPTLGKLRDSLRALSVAPAAITHIVMTHLHPDHADGLVDDAGTAHYPNAEIVVNHVEFDFWMRPNAPNDSDRIKSVRGRTQINFAPYRDRIRLVRDGEEYLGFVAVLAPGHTPGHTCWMHTGLGHGFMAVGDVIHFPTQFSEPDIAVIYDLDNDLAIASRKRILDMAATDRLAIAGAHVPAPGFGRVVRKGANYAFEPSV